ncbi:MAG: formimidoylglutamase [Bacteroidota bacterium]
MDLSVFFQSLSEEMALNVATLDGHHLGHHLSLHLNSFPDWQQADLILIGLPHWQYQPSHQAYVASDAIRRQLYKLSLPTEQVKVCDLGNLKSREEQEDTQEALAFCLNRLIQAGKRILLIGGRQDLTWGQYMAYEGLEKQIEYVQIDARFDLEDASILLDHRSYNHRIFVHHPNYLFNFTNLGHQSYFVSPQARQSLQEMNFFAVRYGLLNLQIQESEPHLRTADMVSFDFGAVRHGDSPGGYHPSPGGFSASEACQMARYAGLGYHLSSMNLTEFDPAHDLRHQTALLGAMMIWYFIDGHYHRRADQPEEDKSNLRKYSVRLHAGVESIDFYEHPVSGRWWMEVPYQDSLGKPFPRTRLVACTIKDYEFAKQDDIPARWWQTYNKLKG